jgi:para-nitrobenzyl esterase
VEPWAGVREASQFGPICPQTGPLADRNTRDLLAAASGEGFVQGEDCLVLNLWTPGLGDGGKRPVMVWLHGRGFGQGAGSEAWYNGAALSKRGDVVVVTINHRLNVFGYLYLEELGGDSYEGTGIAGMLDAVAALEWVRDNVEAFGGDPGNVTIFGESGGGAKVSALLAMPAAQGLFHKAVVQSGPMLRGVSTKHATKLAEDILSELGVTPSNLESLHELPAAEILAAVGRVPGANGGPGAAMRLAPVVDGHHLPSHPFDSEAPATAGGVPVMIGTNRDEAALFLAAHPRRRKLEEHELLELTAPILGEKRDQVLDVYRKAYPEMSPWDLFIAASSERTHIASGLLAERQAATSGAPVYLYLMEWESDFAHGLLKCCHALEIPFVFDNVEIASITGQREDRPQLTEAFSEAWIAFARSGNPSHAGIPEWPAYNAKERPTMIFDVPCRVEQDPRARFREAWDWIPIGL